MLPDGVDVAKLPVPVVAVAFVDEVATAVATEVAAPEPTEVAVAVVEPAPLAEVAKGVEAVVAAVVAARVATGVEVAAKVATGVEVAEPEPAAGVLLTVPEVLPLVPFHRRADQGMGSKQPFDCETTTYANRPLLGEITIS